MDDKDVRIAELEALVAELRKRIVDQRRVIADLTERLNKNSKNSSKPPSTNAPWQRPAPAKRRSGRRRGGQPGHARAERPLVPPEEVSETIDVRPSNCKDCGSPLDGDDPEPIRFQTAEAPSVKPRIIEHRLHALCCARCHSVTRGTLPAGYGPGHFGPRLAAILSLWSGAYRLSKRSVRQAARDCFGLSISLGMIAKLEQQTAEILETPIAEIADAVRTSHVHIDETSWRETGRRSWLWTVVGAGVTLFHIVASRGSAVAKSLLGENYPYIATCDRYAGYLWIGKVQLCWAHLRRDFQAMIDRGGPARSVGEALESHAEVLFEWWSRVRDGTLARSTFITYAGPLRRAFREDLERGLESGCAKTAATCKELLIDEESLWTFVVREGIEPTNNAAERALRHAVLWRKSSFGTDQASGSRFVERILTVVATCRQQHRGIIDYLTDCHQAARLRKPTPSLLPAN